MTTDLPELRFDAGLPGFDDDLAARLDLRSPEDALLLVIVTVAQRPTESTANLLGPLVINQRTRNAAQAVLDPARYATRELLLHTAGDSPGGPGEVPNPEP